MIFFCLLCGKATALLVLRCLHPQLEKYGAKAAKYQDLAMAALKAGDKEAYQNINRLANDAFGHTFFQQVALSAAYLWPVFFALAWLQLRFLDLAVPIPGTPWSLGFIGIFLLIYIGTLAAVQAVRRIWRRCRPVPTSVPPGPVVDTPPAC
uniref:hypothetical protein n=1 Tax=Desulfobacca sp. TaxID=2067990 RepID=UPI004049E619